MKLLKNILFLALIATSLASCVRDVYEKTPEGGQEVVDDGEVIMNLRMPGRFRSTNDTRALSTDAEKEVKNLWVLMFDDDRLIEITKATSRGMNSFAVGLPSAVPGTMVKLVLLANSEEIIAGSIGFDPDAVPDRDYADLMPLIKASISGPMFLSGNDRIPMWGESKEDIEIKTGVQSTRVTLMRSVARIDVGVGKYTEDEFGAFTWNGLTGATGSPNAKPIPFEMTAVYVIKPNTQYRVAPVLSNIRNAGSDAHPSAVSPSIPAGAPQFNSFEDLTSEEVFRFNVQNGKFTTQDIYIPEADIISGQHRTRMALVVGGHYADDDEETYYRVDFADGNRYDNVLRNHLYSFSVMNVMNRGMSTVQEAYNSQAVNMSVDVLDWDEAIINNIWFEGSKYFAMDRQSVVFSPFPGETLYINIKTNIEKFDFVHTAEENPEVRLSSDPTDGKLTYNGSQFLGYQYTLIKKEPTAMADDEYVLEIYNPGDNIGVDPDEERYIDWTIRAMEALKIHFSVDQEHSEGDISLQDGQGTFIPPEGNSESPLPIEIYSMFPVELTATDTATGGPADWIDFGNTSGLSSASDGRDYYFYNHELVVGYFQYGENNHGTTDRTAVINVYIPADGTSVNYTVTQRAPYVRIDRETISESRPLSGTTQAVVSVDVYTNIQPGDLIARQTDGDVNLIHLIDPTGLLEQHDPRNPGNRRFGVRVRFDDTQEGSYGATFEVEDRYGHYGDMPAETVRVVVPPKDEVFNGFWHGATFYGNGLWQPEEMTLSMKETGYVFPWNTTSVTGVAVSNIGLAPDAERMSEDELDRLTMSNPVDYNDGNSSQLYEISYTPEKASYAAPSNHSLAFISTLEPNIVEEDVDIKLGQQVLRVGENAYGSRRFDWKGHNKIGTESEIDITANVGWRADVELEPYGQWFKVRAENKNDDERNTGDYNNAGFAEMDDRVYEPYKLEPDEIYENNLTGILVNETEMQFTVDELDFADLAPAFEPESRQATITIRNNDYDVSKLGASNPAPIIITQWNRVLVNRGVSPALPETNRPLTNDHLETEYTFTARTNLDSVYVDFWELAPDGTRGATPLKRVKYQTNADTSNTPIVVNVAGVKLPDPDVRQRNLLIALSGSTLEQRHEQRLGVWSQASSNPHPGLPFDKIGFPAPPGVLGVNAETGELTLRGSKEYGEFPEFVGIHSEPLSTETVYIALFKRGSLVGLRSGGPGGYDKSQDAIWAAPQYDVENMGSAWTDIPMSPTANDPFPANNELLGYGDPCSYADGHGGEGPWKTPSATSSSYQGPNGWIALETYYGAGGESKLTDKGPYNLTIDTPSGAMSVAVSGGHPAVDQNLFLPYFGYRADGTFTNNDAQQRMFWTSYGGNFLGLGSGGFLLNQGPGISTTDAFPIRCVPK